MAIQATSEEQLRLKKRARQRLLGAAILLMTTAIVLPMVLDQTPRPLNSDIEINMPVAATSVAVPARVTPAADASAAIAAHIEKSEQPVKAQPVVSEPDVAYADVAHQQQIGEAKAAQQKAVEHKTEEAKVALVAEKRKQAEQAKLVHDQDVAHQVALAADKARQAATAKEVVTQVAPAIPSNADTDSGHYVVQLGAFSSAENVRQLREKLNAVGVSTYTESLPSGATRVRAGPFTERGLADKVLEKIHAAGIQAQIVPLTSHK